MSINRPVGKWTQIEVPFSIFEICSLKVSLTAVFLIAEFQVNVAYISINI